MSVNRENVIWQSPEGGYKMGLYDFSYVNESSPDFDFEWDIEYYFNCFSSVYVGVDADDCIRKYMKSNANAGCYNIIDTDTAAVGEIEQYEQMFTTCVTEAKETMSTVSRW